MDWDEACKYTWEGPNTGNIFTFKVEEGSVFYKTEGEWTRWTHVECISPDIGLLLFGYNICRVNPEYETPQEKVCKKIALMEQRHKKYLERKYNV